MLMYNILITPPHSHYESLSQPCLPLITTSAFPRFNIFYFNCDLFSLDKAICVTLDWGYPLEFVVVNQYIGGVNKHICNWKQWLSLYLELTERRI